MTAVAAGRFRRTAAERADPQLSWQRPDQAFFASGACHVLAWICREVHAGPTRTDLEIVTMRLVGDALPFHAYARSGSWTFDHAGWNLEQDLAASNELFEGRATERWTVADDLATFCRENHHRPPDGFWRDPVPRALAFVERAGPPPP